MAIGKSTASPARSSKKKSPPKGEPQKLDSRGVAASLVAEAKGESFEDALPENWADKPDSKAYESALKLYDKIQKCYDNKQDASDSIEEYWNIFNAKPDSNQQYSGNSQCYIPAVRDAIKARMKRTLAQLFPVNHKHVDACGPTGQEPYEVLSLLEHYIRKTNLKNIVRADLIAGDVTGQWNLYIDWKKTYRRVTELVKTPPIKEDAEMGLELEDVTADEDEVLETKDVIDEGPDIVPFATDDLAVYPPTVDRIEDSIASSIRLRMSKEKVQQLIDEGVFVGIDDVDEFFDSTSQPDGSREKRVPEKRRTNDAGIKTEGTYKYALIYEVATDLVLDEESGKREPALVYYAGRDRIIGIIKSPWWSGRRPTLSAPIENISGSFFGTSQVEPVKFLQWNLNDYWNMGMDSAQYALLPIVMTDPLKNPQYQSMVMGLAAIWLTDPNSTKFEQFPPIYKDAMQLCQGIKQQIWESLDVNDAMMGKMPQGRKNNQLVGNMQQEQQTNIVDHAKRYEEVMLNPLIERIFELDQQFRTKDLDVETMGDVGQRAAIKQIKPQQFGQTYFFRWSGTAYQMNTMRQQQMIAAMNVLRGIPPQLLGGKRLDVSPIAEFLTEQVFGPELGPRILIDERNMYTVPADVENTMLHNGLPVEVHEGDDHIEHLRAHDEAAKITTDPSGSYRAHIMQHMQKLQQKQQMMMGQQMQQQGGMPGVPGGSGPAGVAGTPRPGAQPGQPRFQGPAGMIASDNMPGVPGRG